jgi:hypothetical protein
MKNGLNILICQIQILDSERQREKRALLVCPRTLLWHLFGLLGSQRSAADVSTIALNAYLVIPESPN